MEAFVVIAAYFNFLNFSAVKSRLWRFFRYVARNCRRIGLFATLLILNTYNNIYYRKPLYSGGNDTEESTESPEEVRELMNKTKMCETLPLPFLRRDSELYCKATFDSFLCWGYAKAGTTVYQNCPPDLPFIDPSKQARRHCGMDGHWLDRNNETSMTGWTDYIPCFPPYMHELLESISKSIDLNSKYATAVWIRIVEIFGLSASSVSLSVALYFFYKYPKLLNSRTKIHRHLFTVLLTQSLTGLTIYVDQETFNILPQYDSICILVYLIYEILTSISFAFMLIEGVTLFEIISAKALRPTYISQRFIIMAGYVAPTFLTMIWFAIAKLTYGWSQTGCWFGYNLHCLYYILQGPRVFVIILNLIFLAMVVRTLLQKMATDTEAERLLKALRATIILLPLLGITNIISMFSAPLTNSTATFALWAFFAYFLRSMQGLFVSYLYCFKNKEVRDVICGRRSMADIENLQAIRYRTQEVPQAQERVDEHEFKEFPKKKSPEAQERVETNVLDELPRQESPQAQNGVVPHESDTSPSESVSAAMDVGQRTIELTEVIVHRSDE